MPQQTNGRSHRHCILIAAPIRHLLAYLKVDYVDKRYTDPNEWFAKDKFSETLSLSFPNVCYKLYFLNDLLIFSFFVAGSEQLPYYIGIVFFVLVFPKLKTYLLII